MQNHWEICTCHHEHEQRTRGGSSFRGGSQVIIRSSLSSIDAGEKHWLPQYCVLRSQKRKLLSFCCSLCNML